MSISQQGFLVGTTPSLLLGDFPVRFVSFCRTETIYCTYAVHMCGYGTLWPAIYVRVAYSRSRGATIENDLHYDGNIQSIEKPNRVIKQETKVLT